MEKTGNRKRDSYLGFCIRSGKITFGVDNVEKERKNVFLLIADETLGESSFKTVLKVKEKFACPLLTAEKDVLGERLHRPAVKVAAVKDKSLAAAILSVVGDEPHFKIYSGGNN